MLDQLVDCRVFEYADDDDRKSMMVQSGLVQTLRELSLKEWGTRNKTARGKPLRAWYIMSWPGGPLLDAPPDPKRALQFRMRLDEWLYHSRCRTKTALPCSYCCGGQGVTPFVVPKRRLRLPVRSETGSTQSHITVAAAPVPLPDDENPLDAGSVRDLSHLAPRSSQASSSKDERETENESETESETETETESEDPEDRDGSRRFQRYLIDAAAATLDGTLERISTPPLEETTDLERATLEEAIRKLTPFQSSIYVGMLRRNGYTDVEPSTSSGPPPIPWGHPAMAAVRTFLSGLDKELD